MIIDNPIAECKIRLDDGNQICIRIISESSNINTLVQIEEKEAQQLGEAPVQLLEGQSYEYEITKSYSIAEIPGIIKNSKINSSSGRITPGVYIGTLMLEILEYPSNSKKGIILLEVRSAKTTYREDYRNMLADIAMQSAELLMQHSSPVNQVFTIDYLKKAETVYQRFAFIKSIIDSDEFNQAFHKLVSSPVTGWEYMDEEIDIRKTKHIDRKQIRQIASRGDRIPVPETHQVRNTLNTVPRKLNVITKVDTLDIPENRFIKHILGVFLHFCAEVRNKLHYDQAKSLRAYNEALIAEEKLQNLLNHGLFKSLSLPSFLPMNSPVMQRKEGYREFFRFWLMFECAAKIIWQGGNDIYSAGKKDVAVLYEYWLFFKLLELMREIFDINSDSISELIEPTQDGLGLKLKSGQHIALEGRYESSGRRLKIQFSYNKTFEGGMTYPKAGSWSQKMRPDYTLSIWPSEFSIEEAEQQELIVHIHFDAKYKVDFIKDIFGVSEENIDEEKALQRSGTYKRGDLLKMHAYKDAIRRTAGAYILYPGNDTNSIMRGFHEVVPGLGAFAIRPSKENSGIDQLKLFINDVVLHSINRANQYDRTSFYNWYIHSLNDNSKIHEKMPERIGNERVLPPSDTFVLVGFYKNQFHYDWIIKTRLFNVRMDGARGSIRLSPGIAGAKYLLLHTEGELVTSDIWRIVEDGPRVFSKEKMIKMNYPNPNHDNYLVYKIEKIMDGAFGNNSWDLRKFEEFQTSRKSPFPFSVSLTKLMHYKS